MTYTCHEPVPARTSAQAARVVLIGEPSSLRTAVAQQLQAGSTLLARLDTPARLISSGNSLAGAAVVFVTVPRLPGLAARLRHRYRDPA
jgi:hypothetical protein